MGAKALCFIDMPFGKKTDLASGKEVDFDQIYQSAIKPAVLESGLECRRGDEERTGGVIHAAMFARLLLAEYVVADLTLANPNVFYELGIRHSARPFTTVPIFANVHGLPFDVGMVRAIPYQLDNGRLAPEAAAKLKADIKARLAQAIEGPASKDSPLFQLIPKFPGIDLPHEVTDAFQEQMRHEEKFRQLLDAATLGRSNDDARQALLGVQRDLGNLRVVPQNFLVSLMLTFRRVEAWNEMVELCERFPDQAQDLVMVRQQLAFALNRRKRPGDREQAVRILETLIKERGPDPETLGLLGRVHKDRYKDAKQAGNITAGAALDDAIATYTKGFESDPRDYYPGVNAITLLVEKGDAEALREAERLLPLVTFAVARRGGAASSDYWDLATVLELACIGSDWSAAARVLPRTVAAAKESWMPQTTYDNLAMLKQARARQQQPVPQLDGIMDELGKRAAELRRT